MDAPDETSTKASAETDGAPPRAGKKGISVATETSRPGKGGQENWIYRHSRNVRICHWINVIAFVALVFTGMQMLLDYPELYWGKIGYMGHEPALHLRDLGFDLVYTDYGHHVWNIAGFEFSGDREWGRYNHFFFSWLFAVNGLIYLIWNLANGHFRRKMLPRKDEIAPRHLLREIWDHVRFRRPKGEAARDYNTLQKFSYLIVIFVICPLIILSGLAQSPGFVSAFPPALDLFGGGRHTARSMHVLSMVLLLLFLFVHILEVFIAGVVNEVRSMITGKFVLPKEKTNE